MIVSHFSENPMETLQMLGLVECPGKNGVFLHYEKAKEAIASNLGLSSNVDDIDSKRRQLLRHQSTLNKLKEEIAIYLLGERLVHMLHQIEHEGEEIGKLKTELDYAPSDQ